MPCSSTTASSFAARSKVPARERASRCLQDLRSEAGCLVSHDAQRSMTCLGQPRPTSSDHRCEVSRHFRYKRYNQPHSGQFASHCFTVAVHRRAITEEKPQVRQVTRRIPHIGRSKFRRTCRVEQLAQTYSAPSGTIVATVQWILLAIRRWVCAKSFQNSRSVRRVMLMGVSRFRVPCFSRSFIRPLRIHS